MEFLDNKSYFDGDKPLIIPHRGGSNIVPENTLHGLELAIKEEFSHFEGLGLHSVQRVVHPYHYNDHLLGHHDEHFLQESDYLEKFQFQGECAVH